MSRAYTLVRVSRNEHICVDDCLQTSLDVLDVLPATQMAEILAAELQGLGFEREGLTLRRETDGLEVTVDLEARTITVGATDQLDLALEQTGTTRRGPRGEAVVRGVLEQALERRANQVEEQLQRTVTERLEGALADLRQEMDGAVHRATATALKTRAAQLGVVEEITEDEEAGSLTIRVRL